MYNRPRISEEHCQDEQRVDIKRPLKSSHLYHFLITVMYKGGQTRAGFAPVTWPNHSHKFCSLAMLFIYIESLTEITLEFSFCPWGGLTYPCSSGSQQTSHKKEYSRQSSLTHFPSQENKLPEQYLLLP